MKIYAVVDTNVIVSAMISRNQSSAVVKVFKAIMDRRIIPMYNDEILDEYREVLGRKKFHLPQDLVSAVIEKIENDGKISVRVHSDEDFPDSDDCVFYEVALSEDDAYLVTGNARHFPKSGIVVSPARMLEILDELSGI